MDGNNTAQHGSSSSGSVPGLNAALQALKDVEAVDVLLLLRAYAQGGIAIAGLSHCPP